MHMFSRRLCIYKSKLVRLFRGKTLSVTLYQTSRIPNFHSYFHKHLSWIEQECRYIIAAIKSVIFFAPQALASDLCYHKAQTKHFSSKILTTNPSTQWWLEFRAICHAIKFTMKKPSKAFKQDIIKSICNTHSKKPSWGW